MERSRSDMDPQAFQPELVAWLGELCARDERGRAPEGARQGGRRG
jgi:hypothetical protein